MARYTHQDQYTIPGINTEFEKIEQAFKDMLSRVGDSGNALTADVDANGARILNLPEPLSNSEPLTLGSGLVISDAVTEEADRAEQAANSASVSATEAATFASQASTASFEAKQFRDQSEQFATNSEASAQKAADSEQIIESYETQYFNNLVVLPIDLGTVADPEVQQSYDLGTL